MLRENCHSNPSASFAANYAAQPLQVLTEVAAAFAPPEQEVALRLVGWHVPDVLPFARFFARRLQPEPARKSFESHPVQTPGGSRCPGPFAPACSRFAPRYGARWRDRSRPPAVAAVLHEKRRPVPALIPPERQHVLDLPLWKPEADLGHLTTSDETATTTMPVMNAPNHLSSSLSRHPDTLAAQWRAMPQPQDRKQKLGIFAFRMKTCCQRFFQ